jgi:hypothetical protein
MAHEQRAPRDYLAGTLSTAAAISDTALVSDAFSTLPTDYTTTKYLPLTIHDPSTGLYEVVWVTAHASTSTTVTVVRARENTTAKAWPSGSHVICSPTVRDTISASTLAGLPTDAHAGMRVVVTDKGYVAERTGSSLWGASVGVALADDIGPGRSGVYPNTINALWLRAGHVTGGVTNGSGQVSVNYRQPFPNQTVSVMITALSPSVPIYSIHSESNLGFTVQVWQVASLAPFTTTTFSSGYSANFSYLAIGY